MPDPEYDNDQKIRLKRVRYNREEWLAELINDINHIKRFEWQLRGEEFPYDFYTGNALKQKIKRFKNR